VSPKRVVPHSEPVGRDLASRGSVGEDGLRAIVAPPSPRTTSEDEDEDGQEGASEALRALLGGLEENVRAAEA
jgi:hypothetical protein